MSDSRVTTGEPLPQGFGEDPLAHYTRVFVRFLQLVFASFEKGSYRWCEDMQLTDIVVTGEKTINREVVEKRPAIVIGRGPVAFTNIAVDQFAGPLLDPKTGQFTPNLDPISGARRHTDLLSASVTYNCLAQEGLEAQRIAWTSAYATRALKRALMQAGRIHRVGEDMQVGSESAPGAIVQPDAEEITMVTVSVPFYFQQTWTVESLDKTLLTNITMALRSEVGSDLPEPIIKAPGMNGQTFQNFKSIPLSQAVVVKKTATPLK